MTKYSDLKTKKDKIAFLKQKLGTNYAWALRGLVRIYEFQTASEQASGYTQDWNGVGFSGADSEILSSFAQQVEEKRFAGSPKQCAILFKKMPKYARQLMNIADADAKAKAAEEEAA